MKICIPVIEDKGQESRISPHFGSAPGFMLVDSREGELSYLGNNNSHHAHGMCQPLAALAGHPVEVVLVGGIGMGALCKRQAGGIAVYLCDAPTVGEAVLAFKEGRLSEADAGHACGGHGHGGHSHGHGQGHGGGCGKH